MVFGGVLFRADGPAISLNESGVFVQMSLQYRCLWPVSWVASQTRGEYVAKPDKWLMSGELS